jgi:protein-tyrosine-phosphatase
MLAEQLGCAVTDLAAHDVLVRSAGAFAMAGARATPEAIEAMRERGIDLSHHTSSALSHELINQADWIFAMTRGHMDTIAGMAPLAADKVVLLGGESDIEDPMGKSPAEYEACAREIEQALAIRLKEVEP